MQSFNPSHRLFPIYSSIKGGRLSVLPSLWASDSRDFSSPTTQACVLFLCVSISLELLSFLMLSCSVGVFCFTVCVCLAWYFNLHVIFVSVNLVMYAYWLCLSVYMFECLLCLVYMSLCR